MNWYKKAQSNPSTPSNQGPIGKPFDPNSASDLQTYTTELTLPIKIGNNGELQNGPPKFHTVTIYYQLTSSPIGDKEEPFLDIVHITIDNTDVINMVSPSQKNEIQRDLADENPDEPYFDSDDDFFTDEAVEWGGLNYP